MEHGAVASYNIITSAKKKLKNEKSNKLNKPLEILVSHCTLVQLP